MKVTFDPSLPTDRDWVRLECGDCVNGKMTLDDQTIDTILLEEPNKYFAAARCCELILVLRDKARGGVIEKEVDEVRIRYGSSGSSGSVSDYQQHAAWLRIEGARKLLPTGQRFIGML